MAAAVQSPAIALQYELRAAEPILPPELTLICVCTYLLMCKQKCVIRLKKLIFFVLKTAPATKVLNHPPINANDPINRPNNANDPILLSYLLMLKITMTVTVQH